MSIRAVVLLAVLWCCAGMAHAQEFNNSCTGYIDSLPATIVKPGTWCLRRDLLAPAGRFDVALTVLTDDATIDCRGFRISAIPGVASRQNIGIVASDQSNTTVRHCKIRGFWAGMLLAGERGLMVQDNLVEDSTYLGIYVQARASMVRRNSIVRTGGATDIRVTIGIHAGGGVDVTDNMVVDLSPPRLGIPGGSAGRISMIGIVAVLNAGSISGNRIRQETAFSPYRLTGILTANNLAKRALVRHNDLIGPGGPMGVGISCYNAKTFVVDNAVNGFATGVDASCTSQGNYLLE